MSVFVRKDPRSLACADPPWPLALYRMLRRHACVAAAIILTLIVIYAAEVITGLHVAAQTSGRIGGLALRKDVTIARDAHGIPYIHARNMHDLFFAQGFAEASDRLFEMDLTRRYAYGRLAEVFGSKALPIDLNMRALDISGIARRQWRGSDAATRSALQAFSDGVNAAEQRQPLPVEFRMLLYRPAPWTPRDSIAVSAVAAFELGDSWRDVLARDERWKALSRKCFSLEFPLSDPRYDVSIDGRAVLVRSSSTMPAACDDNPLASIALSHPRIGSNAWAAGSQRTRGHRALLANDPHVDLTIPGIWYAVELEAPGFHAAGTIIPGLPGVALGHNERIAWAATNAEAATTALYSVTAPLPRRSRVEERFDIRFGTPLFKTYYRTRDTFSVQYGEDRSLFLVRWPTYTQRRSSIATLLALDRSHSIHDAVHALALYRGAPQNFIVADTHGAIAYHLAGAIWNDPAWGRYTHDSRDLAIPLRLIAFSDLPSRAPSSNAVLLSANNRMYGPRYPYRLSAAFELPYRAYRIAQLLHARKQYDLGYFQHMQMDACSPIDAEIARDVTRITKQPALDGWNGCFSPASKRATLEYDLRNQLLDQNASFGFLIAKLRAPPYDGRDGVAEDANAALDFAQEVPSWGKAGQVSVDHPLSDAWYGLLRGAPLPGDGNEYTIHLQEPGFAQGFRAVWDVGNWNSGGIVLPSGESGEPGSGHYDDFAKTWLHGGLVPLPFTHDAITRGCVKVLTLGA
ncbi:MAG TPA: penicillin acylase family protein [Candidatus Baltobacteraceae bacterium]|nr:penicillin acylase family protein [Candidatus Baltobacteraceae bacterium]